MHFGSIILTFTSKRSTRTITQECVSRRRRRPTHQKHIIISTHCCCCSSTALFFLPRSPCGSNAGAALRAVPDGQGGGGDGQAALRAGRGRGALCGACVHCVCGVLGCYTRSTDRSIGLGGRAWILRADLVLYTRTHALTPSHTHTRTGGPGVRLLLQALPAQASLPPSPAWQRGGGGPPLPRRVRRRPGEKGVIGTSIESKHRSGSLHSTLQSQKQDHGTMTLHLTKAEPGECFS